jgi:serine/threonine-protein kinase RsbW
MTEPVSRELKIPNETSRLAEVREAVREVVAEAGFPDGELNRLTLAVDESVTNIMEHAYEDDLEGEMFIEVSLRSSDSEFTACIRDRGKAFDPTDVPAPDLSHHVQEGRRHGLGIFLMRRIMDEVSYTTGPDGLNELKLTKRASAGKDGEGAGAAAAGKDKPTGRAR